MKAQAYVAAIAALALIAAGLIGMIAGTVWAGIDLTGYSVCRAGETVVVKMQDRVP